jgi:hypothetical protein
MYNDNKPKANWVQDYGVISVSEKGAIRVRTEDQKQSCFMTYDLAELVVNHAEDLLKAIELAKELKKESKANKDKQKIEIQIIKAKERAALQAQAALEQLARLGVDITKFKVG